MSSGEVSSSGSGKVQYYTEEAGEVSTNWDFLVPV